MSEPVSVSLSAGAGDLPGGDSPTPRSDLAGLVSLQGKNPITELAQGQFSSVLDFELRLFAERIALQAGRFAQATHSLTSTRASLLPHQIRVAHWAVHNPFSRGLLLADEVGLGKTVEAALIMKELICRGKAQRILVLVPAKLLSQWQHELWEKIREEFQIIRGKEIKQFAAQGQSVWVEHNRVIMSIELARLCGAGEDAASGSDLAKRPWDLVVVDEAHSLKDPASANHQLVAGLPRTYTLFLTATPIRNYAWDLFHLSGILESREEKPLGTKYSFRKTFLRDAKGLQIQHAAELAERLQRFLARNTRARVPEVYQVKRVGRTFHFQLQGSEAAFQRLAEDYIYGLYRDGRTFRGEFYKVLLSAGLQKLAASSREAALPTLTARRARLEELLTRGLPETDEGEQTSAGEEAPAEDLALPSSAAGAGRQTRSAEEKLDRMREEVAELKELLAEASRVQGNAKLDALLHALHSGAFPAGEKVLVFTEYRRTQAMLVEALGRAGYRTAAFHGGLLHSTSPGSSDPTHPASVRQPTREEVFRRFCDASSDGVQILVATEAAAEGLNLQFCRVLVNYDLPWNPQKIEQRIGRLHRIGQTRDVIVINLAAQGSIDDELITLLQEKIRLFNTVLGESELILGAIDEAQVLNFEEKLLEIAALARGPEEVRREMARFRQEMDAVLRERQERMRRELKDFDDRVTDHLNQSVVLPEQAEQIVRLKNADVLNFVARYLRKHEQALIPSDLPGVYEFETPPGLRARVPHLSPRYRATFFQETANLAIDADYIAHGHPFLTAAVDECLAIGRTARIQLHYTDSEQKLHGFDHLPGQRGLWATCKAIFRSFDREECLFSVFVRPGGADAGDFVSRMLYYRLVDHPLLTVDVDALREPVVKALGGQLEAPLAQLLRLNREVFEEEAAKIDTYFADSLLEFEDKEKALLREMERVQAKRHKARVFEERKAFREQYERLKDQYLRLQREIFERRRAKNQEREEKIHGLQRRVQPQVEVVWVSAALVEVI
jgi:superfamily II DNA or RNA helicase